jgi:hypothetical protein
LNSSELWSTHAPPHRFGAEVGQLHTPDVQTPPTAHLVPQALQCVGSLVRSAQASVHNVLLDAQVQVPLLHVSPGKHACPQPPQLPVSALLSTQTELHKSGVPLGHAHWPLEQVAPTPHTVLQSPQCAASLCVSTHPLPQSI